MRLLQLGSNEFYRMGLGDDQHSHGFEAELDSWLKGLFPVLDTRPDVEHETTLRKLVVPLYKVEHMVCGQKNSLISNRNYERQDMPSLIAGDTFKHKRFFLARVLSNSRVTSKDHFQRLSIPLDQEFHAGSCIGVYPCADEHKVNTFVTQTLRLHLNDRIIIRKNGEFPMKTLHEELGLTEDCLSYSKFFVEKNISLQQAFRNHFDITSLPTRTTLRILAHFCANKLHKDKLLELSEPTAEGRESYYEFVKTERRSIAEVLWDFDSCIDNLPMDYLFSLIPVMEARYYSIASAPYWYSPRAWWCIGGVQTLIKSPILFIAAAPLVGAHMFSPKQHIESGTALHCHYSDVLRRVHRLTSRVASSYRVNMWENLQRWSLNNKDEQYIDICVALTYTKTRLQRDIEGLCSSYLVRYSEGNSILCYIHRETEFPTTKGSVFVISTGTGVAPTRSLIQTQYMSWKASVCDGTTHTAEDGNPFHLVILGFREAHKDFLFRNDWMHLASRMEVFPRGSLVHFSEAHSNWNCSIYIAFSREDADNKVYVQDVLRKIPGEVKRIFGTKGDTAKHEQPLIVISGRSHPMPSQVLDYLTEALRETVETTQEVKTMLNTHKKKGCLIFETWGV